MPPLFLAALAVLALTLAACGDSGDATDASSGTTGEVAADTTVTEGTTTESSEAASTTSSVSDSCSDVETFDVPASGTHFNRDFTVDDYPTNPPTAGDHNPTPIDTGQFYSSSPRLGEAVHALEHGAVIGWTNGLSPDDQKTVEDAFNEEYGKGYYQLAVVEFPDLEGTFAMSSWDSLQHCEAPDPGAISAFVEEHYAPETTAERLLACTGKASRLPACK